eukprot:gb/GECH01007989.1/.p1 GENE.gb/GECH01007989.1/~~gb/GECH01007989.1/.p1  ORF type:complete len:431 (+),score=122.91 gb/GECH01007989.1/:1-1293(+)
MKWMPVSIIPDTTPHQTSTTTHSHNKLFNYMCNNNAFAALQARAKTKSKIQQQEQQFHQQHQQPSNQTTSSHSSGGKNPSVFTPSNRWYHSASIIETSTPMNETLSNDSKEDRIQRRMFIFGGTTNTSYNVLLNDLHYIDIPEDFCSPRSDFQNVPIRWHKVECSDPPSKRWGHSGLAWNKYLVVFGGCDGYMYLNELLFFDTENMKWERRSATGKYPAPRAGHKATIIGENILVLFGGWNGTHLNDVHFLDLQRMQWLDIEIKGKAPPARADHAVTVVGNRMFLFGGEGVGYDIKLGDVHVLDFDRMEWTSVHTFGKKPTARHSHSVSTIGKHVVVFGGYDDQYNQCNDVWILDTVSMIWKQIYENQQGQLGAIVGRQGHSACVFRSKVIFFAGFNGGALNDTFILDTELCEAHSEFEYDISSMTTGNM